MKSGPGWPWPLERLTSQSQRGKVVRLPLLRWGWSATLKNSDQFGRRYRPTLERRREG